MRKRPTGWTMGGMPGAQKAAARLLKVGGNGQRLPGAAEVAPHQPCIAIPARAEELRRLLGASIDENSQHTAHVRWLEAELRRSSVELAKLRGELRGTVHDALTDALSGLANRRSFDLELGAVAARVGRSLPAHLVMADTDRFKRVNDTHGLDILDEVLRIVADVLLADSGATAWSPVWAETSSGSCCHGPARTITVGIATRVCELLAPRPLVVRGHPEVIERITLSIGVAGWHAGESIARWSACTDAALYEAKRRGRNQISIARILELEF